MEDIQRVLRRAAWRLGFIDGCQVAVVLLAVALSAAILLRVSQQAFGFGVPWLTVVMWGGPALLVISILFAFARRASRLAVARRVDEGAGLRETISTALSARDMTSPWVVAVLETARQRARTVDVARAVPIESPRFWPVPFALALALGIIWVSVPQFDLLGIRTQKQAEADSAQQAQVAKAEAAKIEKKIQEVAAKLNLDEGKEDEPASPDSDKPEIKDPEQIRRDAIRKATNLKEQLNQLKEGEKGLQLEAIRDAMRQLKAPGDGPLTALARELSRGNFDKAGAELDKLKAQLADGTLNQKDKQIAGEQLAKLADQLDKLAADKRELERELEKAGLDKSLASNPEALQAALQKNDSLSEELKQKLAQKCNSQCKAAKACQSMASACKNAGQGMKGSPTESAEGMQGMGEQLSELEQLASELDSADAELAELSMMMSDMQSQCQGSSPCEGLGECSSEGTGDWKAGQANSKGRGQGGPGQGSGSGIGEQMAAIDRQKRKFKSSLQAGPIVGSMMVEGEQIKGESSAEFSAAVEVAEQDAAEDMEENVIPREYQEAIKSYYGRLKAKQEGKTLKDPAPATPPSEPAESKKSE